LPRESYWTKRLCGVGLCSVEPFHYKLILWSWLKPHWCADCCCDHCLCTVW